ncbi:MAG: ABC transporter substrate-binding protein [Proteobacteria bacterium]|nr:ABC transporter substrate-binding protein [Pseudomonadota bacterium]MDA1057877.1 ABC transporter substrate-binding protein [Pseudomonadota bacterium]
MSQNSGFFRPILGALSGLVLAAGVLPGPAAAANLIETPMFRDAVRDGTLPAVDERVPAEPSVVKFAGDLRQGRQGGEIKMLVGRARDVRLLVVYGYARLVGYDDKLELQPDLLRAVDVEDDRIYTMHLRKGHKWSNGDAFTTEDFRYWWEDVANNDELSPAGPPIDMLVDGAPPTFEVIDETTVRFSWAKPNPSFLAKLAGASPLFIYRPSEFLKKFHINHATPEELETNAGGARSWASRHNRVDNLYKFDNPDLPTLQPWMNITRPPANRFEAVRNPYYHRIDEGGHQLPYIDRIFMSQASAQLIPAKAGSGEVDLQARAIFFNNFPFLKQGEERNGYKTYLWREAKGSHIALYPNLNIDDPVWRDLFRDVRFRRALSLSVDRGLINEALYFGLAVEGNNTVLPDSPLFKEEYQLKWATYDPDEANDQLDAMGLTERNGEGTRLLPDGRPIEIVVETAGESTEETDVLQLITESWTEIGVKLFSKPSQREVFRNRIFAGQTQMAVWTGWENGVPTPGFEPSELAVTSQHQYQWPQWGQFYETKGKSGEAVDMPIVQQLDVLHDEWLAAKSLTEREMIWHKMLAIHADQVFTIGIVSGVMQPIVVNDDLRNVPKEGMFNWDPGAHFGIYRPDTFWLAR